MIYIVSKMRCRVGIQPSVGDKSFHFATSAYFIQNDYKP